MTIFCFWAILPPNQVNWPGFQLWSGSFILVKLSKVVQILPIWLILLRRLMILLHIFLSIQIHELSLFRRWPIHINFYLLHSRDFNRKLLLSRWLDQFLQLCLDTWIQPKLAIFELFLDDKFLEIMALLLIYLLFLKEILESLQFWLIFSSHSRKRLIFHHENLLFFGLFTWFLWFFLCFLCILTISSWFHCKFLHKSEVFLRFLSFCSLFLANQVHKVGFLLLFLWF